MSFIKTIPADQAEGKLVDVYKRIPAIRKQEANILQISSINPKALDTHFSFYLATMFNKTSPLSRIDCELIATIVSQTNSCHY